MKPLSNIERKYRSKIIAEHHLKKDAQRYIDFYVVKNNDNSINLTYKYLYFNYGLLRSILTRYNLSKLNSAFQGLGRACAKATNSMTVLAASFRELGDYEKCKYLKR